MKRIILSQFSLFILIFLALLTSYTNCSQSKNEQEQNAQDLSSTNYMEVYPGLAEINYFKTNPPSSMSGISGYSYLLNEYLGPHCGTCHRTGSPWPPNFADRSNVALSYNELRLFLDKNGKIDEFRRRITGTSNCHPECDLDTRGQVYKAINYWLMNRY